MAVPATHTAALENFQSAEKADLDPKLYLGTFEADLMVGGIVSGNRTLYPADDTEKANEALQRAIENGFKAPGQLGHANQVDGPSFDLPVRLLSVEMERPREGVVEVRGVFALTNTVAGRDIHVIQQIGFPVGVSLNGFVVKEAHRITRDSEFYGPNKAHVGEDITIHRDLVFNDLSPFDLVRMPSFDTFVAGPATESVHVQEALGRLAGVLKNPNMQPASEQAAQTPQPKEAGMTPEEQIAKLEADLAEVRESQTKSVETQKASEAKIAELNEANEHAAKALEASTKTTSELQSKLTAAEAQEDEDKVAALQAASEAQKTELAETREELKQLKAEAEGRKQLALLAATVKEHASGDHSDLVLEGLTDLCKGGMLTDAEKVKEQADRLRGLFGRAAVKPTGEAKVKPADEGADDETHETPAFEGALLDLEFVAQMNALSGTPAQEAAGEEN